MRYLQLQYVGSLGPNSNILTRISSWTPCPRLSKASLRSICLPELQKYVHLNPIWIRYFWRCRNRPSSKWMYRTTLRRRCRVQEMWFGWSLCQGLSNRSQARVSQLWVRIHSLTTHWIKLTFNSEEGHKATECEKPKDPARAYCRNCETGKSPTWSSFLFSLTLLSWPFHSRLQNYKGLEQSQVQSLWGEWVLQAKCIMNSADS